MGFIVNREAKLVCDDCSKEKITTRYSNNYNFKVLKVGHCYQSGNGSTQDFELIDNKEIVLCGSCYNKRMGDLQIKS